MFLKRFIKVQDTIPPFIFFPDLSLIDYDFNSGVNGLSKHLYETDDQFLKIYHTFLKDLYDKLGFDFYFQEAPTVRIHCPNAKNEHHYPRYHSDCFYGHPPEEINVWFTLTSNKNSGFDLINYEQSKNWLTQYNYDTNAFVDKAINDVKFNEYGKSIATDMNADLDNILLFNSLCIHSNHPRLEDSRVSMDIRINPVSNFVDGYVGAGRMKAEFKPGGKFGYHKNSIKELI